MADSAARIDAELRRLHGSADAAALSELHERGAALMPDKAACRFQLTQAWVYALVAGDDARISALEARLRQLGGL